MVRDSCIVPGAAEDVIRWPGRPGWLLPGSVDVVDLWDARETSEKHYSGSGCCNSPKRCCNFFFPADSALSSSEPATLRLSLPG